MDSIDAIKTVELTKSYGQLTALDHCSLSVSRGEVFGLLGPNGAGKTTLIRLLLGFLKPTSGQAWVEKADCLKHSLEIRRRVAYLPGDPRLFRHMSGTKVLDFFAQIRPSGDPSRFNQLAERLELDLRRRVGSMSTGMRQKLALVATLGAGTPIVILDEPTSNLDPTMRSEVMRMVAEAKQAGRTVLFSSHVLPEVEQVCDRVGILKSGKLVHLQAMSDLREQHRIYLELANNSDAQWSVPENLDDVLTLRQRNDNNLMLESSSELPPILQWLATLPLTKVRLESVRLQAIYDRFHPAGGRGPLN